LLKTGVSFAGQIQKGSADILPADPFLFFTV
jgi:hypothetical protein